jgi:hypothetical protein
LLIKPNTSHRTLHHLAGVRFRSPARAAAVVADVDPGVEVTHGRLLPPPSGCA